MSGAQSFAMYMFGTIVGQLSLLSYLDKIPWAFVGAFHLVGICVLAYRILKD